MNGRFLGVGLICGLASCAPPAAELGESLPAGLDAVASRDFERELCRARIDAVRAEADLGGTPGYDARRAEILGRATGEPVVFVAEPPPRWAERGERQHPQVWVRSLIRRHRADKPELRAQLLRGGYVFADDPQEAFALVRELTFEDLFDEPEVWLLRGDVVRKLERKPAREHRGHEYRYTDGHERGRTAMLLFGDRVAVDERALDEPLHRDVRSLRDREGFERITLQHRTRDALVAGLRFGGVWETALIDSDGARLELACIDAPRERRDEIARLVEADAPRRRALASLQQAIGDVVADKLPFDRPREVTDHFSDGQLRPKWRFAYQNGHHHFTHDDKTYPVFDRDGMPYPPEMCVEMILDSYERAAGTWYLPAGQERKRVVGRLDFDAFGIGNRAGVLAFETFAASKPELFDTRRFSERIPFRERERFFAYLVAHADTFMPGDVVAIQGLKADGHIHQHAILVEDVDPVTGMPFALADQMKRPRRRTWEGIMAEAPLRALLYHVRPKPELFLRLDPGEPRAHTASL